MEGYHNEGLVVQDIAVGVPPGLLRAALAGEPHERLALHPALLHQHDVKPGATGGTCGAVTGQAGSTTEECHSM